MYIQVTRSIFHDQFQRTRPDQFTYAGLNALFDYLEEIESEAHNGDAGDNQLDVIAICCEFSQFDSVEEACEAYGKETMEALQDFTIVLPCEDGSVVIQLF
jgi:hypothetical protein